MLTASCPSTDRVVGRVLDEIGATEVGAGVEIAAATGTVGVTVRTTVVAS